MENKRIYNRTSTIFLLLICFAALSIASVYYFSKKTEEKKNQESKKGFAVVELFTSEGCAACPPAHELLAKIERDNPTKNIYTLAYHVHFWDREKWKDQFSNVEYSRRQLNYAKWLNVPKVYAPQVVVNGQSEFAGTDELKIQKIIDESLIRSSKIRLKIQAAQDDDKLIVNYQVQASSETMYLQLAIVQKSSSGEVKEGGHKGHLFTHVQTVRGFHSKQLTKEGRGIIIIEVPQGFNSKEWEAIAIVQDSNNNGEILAARKVDL